VSTIDIEKSLLNVLLFRETRIALLQGGSEDGSRKESTKKEEKKKRSWLDAN